MKPKVFLIQFILMLTLVTNARSQEDLQGVRARSRQYEPLIASTAARYDVDAELLWTIAYLESRFSSGVVSYKNGQPCAYGMMQFIGPTARRYGLNTPHNAFQAIDAAARYVRDLKTRFGGDRTLIMAAYNAGEGTVEAFRDGKVLVLTNGKVINPFGIRTGGVPPYKETRNYVARGNLVYRKISQSGLFQRYGKGLSERLPDGDVSVRNNSKAESAGASTYAQDVYPLNESSPTARPARLKLQHQPTQSIYVN